MVGVMGALSGAVTSASAILGRNLFGEVSKAASLAALVLLMVVGSGCARSSQPPAPETAALGLPAAVTQAQYETGGATGFLPEGEPQAGRQAFLDLKCVVCHRVTGESAFPAPVSVSQGPTLDGALQRRPFSELAAAIVLPSHAMSLKTSEQIKQRPDGALSPMPDFSRIMTVRQLADLLAYLRSLGTAR
jgi:mono/diheme cytochrome c family protein